MNNNGLYSWIPESSDFDISGSGWRFQITSVKESTVTNSSVEFSFVDENVFVYKMLGDDDTTTVYDTDSGSIALFDDNTPVNPVNRITRMQVLYYPQDLGMVPNSGDERLIHNVSLFVETASPVAIENLRVDYILRDYVENQDIAEVNSLMASNLDNAVVLGSPVVLSDGGWLEFTFDVAVLVPSSKSIILEFSRYMSTDITDSEGDLLWANVSQTAETGPNRAHLAGSDSTVWDSEYPYVGSNTDFAALFHHITPYVPVTRFGLESQTDSNIENCGSRPDVDLVADSTKWGLVKASNCQSQSSGPSCRTQAASIEKDGIILVFGGSSLDTTELSPFPVGLNDLWAYNVSMSKWIMLQENDCGLSNVARPRCRFGHTMDFVDDSTISVFGGRPNPYTMHTAAKDIMFVFDYAAVFPLLEDAFLTKVGLAAAQAAASSAWDWAFCQNQGVDCVSISFAGSFDHSSVAVGNDLYIYGGTGCKVFDAAGSTCSPANQLPTDHFLKLTYQAGSAWDEKFIFTNLGSHADLTAATCSGASKKCLTASQMVYTNGKLYVFGGKTDSDVEPESNILMEYDIEGDMWSTLSEPDCESDSPPCLFGHGATLRSEQGNGTTLVVLGGVRTRRNSTFEDRFPSSGVYEYYFSSGGVNGWTVLHPHNSPEDCDASAHCVSGHAVATSGEGIFVFGGYQIEKTEESSDGNTDLTNSLWEYRRIPELVKSEGALFPLSDLDTSTEEFFFEGGGFAAAGLSSNTIVTFDNSFETFDCQVVTSNETYLVCEVDGGAYGAAVNVKVNLFSGSVWESQDDFCINFGAPTIDDNQADPVFETGSFIGTEGGQTITITGTNFGPEVVASRRITIGENECNSVTRINPTTLSCVSPAGVGRNLAVTLHVGDQSVTLSDTISYKAPYFPRLHEALTFLPTLGGAFVNVSVCEAGESASTSAPLVTIDSVPCLDLEWIGDDLALACLDSTVPRILTCKTPPVSGATGVDLPVAVSIGGQTSDSVELLASYSPPVVSSVFYELNEDEKSTAGGYILTILGTNFGTSRDGDYPLQASLGGTLCSSTTLLGTKGEGLTIQTVLCVAPAGSGTNNTIQVTAGSRVAVAASTFDYSRPVIESFSPKTLTVFERVTITVTGRNFGLDPSKLKVNVRHIFHCVCLFVFVPFYAACVCIRSMAVNNGLFPHTESPA